MTHTPPAYRNTARRKWLRSASIMAAATAMVAGGGTAFAQSRPVSGGPSAMSGVDRIPVRIHEVAPQAGRRAPLPTINTRALPPQTPVAHSQGNPIASPSQAQASINPAPNFPSVQVPAATRAFAAAGTMAVPRNTSTVNGVSVNASASFDTNTISFTPGAAGDVVTVRSSAAIIDWTTFDAGAPGEQVTFLGTGENLTFAGGSDFTVLNRITTPSFDSAIAINGNVTSTVNGSQGGNIWFYSPGGIVLGSGATFNIGSLLLSTSVIDPADVVAGAFDVSFTGTPDSGSAIDVRFGATINATNSGSYVALVAPRIAQRGTINTNGSVALVAAEQATLSIQNGLFDISVGLGTEDSNGIIHSGTTGGAGSSALGDGHAIYFVAVPKNDALTMLMSGSIGYEAATGAAVENGRIILTTGSRVERVDGREFQNGNFIDVSSNTLGTEELGVTSGNVVNSELSLSSSTQILATDTIIAGAQMSTDNSFDLIAGGGQGDPVDLELIGGNAVDLFIVDGAQISVTGNLTISSGDERGSGGEIAVNLSTFVGGGGIGGGGGPVQVGPGSNGNTLNVGGNFNINAGAVGLDDVPDARNNGGTGIGADSVAGNISFSIGVDSVVSVGGALTLDASANGGGGDVSDGSATAGNVILDLASNATLDIGGSLVVDASARRAGSTFAADQTGPLEGSDSIAGAVAFNFENASLDVAAISVNAQAEASSGTSSSIAQSNDAIGGTFTLNVDSGSYFADSLEVSLNAQSATSHDGVGGEFIGRADRGQANVSIIGPSVAFETNNGFSISANASGDAGIAANPAINLTVQDTGSGIGEGLLIGGDLALSATARNGAPARAARGGEVNILVENAVLAAGGLDLFADASLEPFGRPAEFQGNDFRGGDISVTARNGGIITISGFSQISANGTSAVNPSVTAAGLGEGGTITILADDGSIAFASSLFLDANGFAFSGVNANGEGAQGIGGLIDITVQGNDGSLSFNQFDSGTDGSISFDGEVIDTFFAGPGSSGVGGLTQFNILGGTLAATSIDVSSDGEGGPAGERASGGIDPNTGFLITGNGGAGVGGEVVFNVDGGNTTVGDLTVSANGVGGEGAFGSVNDDTGSGDGGDATGGTATFNALSGTLSVTGTLSVEATGNRQFSGGFVSGGRGGSGSGAPGGDGGSSQGGDAIFNLVGSAVIDAGAVVVSTQAFGGTGGSSDNDFNGNEDQGGGAGGNASGGNALFNDTAGDITFGSLTVNASGVGGQGGGSFGLSTGDAAEDGGAGGNGVGGLAQISLNQDDTEPKTYTVISQGVGGEGGLGARGGDGGSGQGGTAELIVNNVDVVFEQLTIDARAAGGEGGFSDGFVVNDGADGGSATGGTAQLRVAGPQATFTANSTIALFSSADGGTGAEGGFSNFANPLTGGAGGLGGSASGGDALVVAEDGAVIAINPFLFAFEATGTGGDGGGGGGNFDNGVAGSGGAGGDGTGGSVGFVANTGANLTIDPNADVFSLSADGIGGSGGEGGDAGVQGTPADGGDGGRGIGGTPLISATGASILAGEVNLTADGTGGDGGLGGVASNLNGRAGTGGDGIGGTPRIEAIEGSPGIVTLGQVFLSATGVGGSGQTIGLGNGGQITISDTSTDPLGLISIADLGVNALGDAGTNSGLLTITSNSGPITVDGSFTADVTGAMVFDMFADGQLVVTGETNLNATDAITLSATNAVGPTPAFVGGGAFNATVSAGSFSAFVNGNIETTGAVAITAESISYDTITSTGTVDLIATAGSITGTSTGTITASNILDAIDLLATQDVTFGNLITTQGNIDIDAGDDITGGTVDSAQFINVDAPGVVNIGSLQTSRSTIGTIAVNAGSMDLGSVLASSIVNLTTDQGDLTIGDLTTPSSVDLNSARDILVDLADTGQFSADAVNDVDVGSVTTIGTVADLILNAGGTVSYNSLDSDRLIAVTADAIVGGNAVADDTVIYTAGSIDVEDITTREIANVVLTTDASGLSSGFISASQGQVTINSAADVSIAGVESRGTTSIDAVTDVDVGDIDAGGSLRIVAGGNLLAGDLFSGTISPGLSLNIGGDADVLSAFANALLDVNIGGVLTGGDFTGTLLTTIDADTIDILSANGVNGTVNVTGINSVAIGSVATTASSNLIGASVNIDSGDIGSNFAVTSTLGDITGLGTILVGNNANFNSAANIAIGTLEATNISLSALNDIQFNGLISPNSITVTADGLIGATTPGQGNINSGGAVLLNGAIINLGDIFSDTSITADATGADAVFGNLNAGTFIRIDAVGSPIVQSVTSVGNTTLTGSAVSLNGGDVGAELSLEALTDDITLAFEGAEQLVVDGGASFVSARNMNVTHINNAADTVSIDVGGNINVDVARSFSSAPASILSAGGELIIRAQDNIVANDLRAGPAIVLEAGLDIDLNNAAATGPQGSSNFRGIIIDAGLINGPGFSSFNPGANATISGAVTSYANIDISAGANAVFSSGSNTAADNALLVVTGDDIIVETGAVLSSANNPTDPIIPALPFDGGPNIILDAGGETNLLSSPPTPIASIVLDGSLNANGASIILDANAIDGLDSTLLAGSIKADLRDAPASGVAPSDDNGLLIAPCLEGTVCLGNMQASNRIEIGLESNNDVIQLFIEQATVNAVDISIVTREDIVMGTSGINTELNATGTFSATSITGNVDLRDAAISADQILIDAAGSLLGSGFLTSANDIGVTVGDSIIVGGFDTLGELTNVADVGGDLEGFYTVTGDFIAGVYSQGAVSIDLSAGGNISLGEASSPGDIVLSATGDAFLGNASVPGDIIIDGASVGFDFLDANAVFLSGFGPISGGDIVSAGDVDIEGDNVDIGDVDAANTVTTLGTSIAVGAVTAQDIDLTSDSDILFNRLDSANAIALDASAGTIASNGGNGDIISAGNVSLEALSISIGDVSSQGSVTANASDGDAGFGVVNAATDIVITAAGTPSVVNAISGGSTAITGSSVTLDNGAIGTDLTLVALLGDIDGNGAITVGGAIDFSAPGNVGFGDLTAQGGSFVVDAGGDLTFSGATSTDFINLTAGGSVLGGDLNATNDVSVDGASIAVGDVIADQIDLTSAADILFNLVQSPNAITLTANGGAIGANTGAGDIITDGDVTLLGVSIAVGQIDAGGAVDAMATGAGLSTAAINAGDAVDLEALNGAVAAGDISAASDIGVNGAAITLGNLTSTSDSLATLNADSITFGSATDLGVQARANDGSIAATGAINNSNIVDLEATQDVTVGDINTNSTLILDAGRDVAFGTVETSGASTLLLRAGNDITGASANRTSAINAGSNLSIEAGGVASIEALNSGTMATVTGGDLDLGTVTTNTSLEMSGNTIAFDDVTAGTNATITATNGDLIGNVTAGEAAVLAANGGAITLENLTAASADLTASGALDVGEATVGGVLTGLGSSVDIASTNSLTVDVTATGGDIAVNTQGDLTAINAAASGDLRLQTALGSVTVNNAQGTNVDLVSGRNDVQIVGSAQAVETLTVSAFVGFDAIDAAAIGQVIDITSQDVALSSDSLIGDATITQSVTFRSSGEGRVGGAPTGTAGWELDNAELSRVFSAGDIEIFASGDQNGVADLGIGQLDVIAGDGSSSTGQNIGQAGSLSLFANGDIEFSAETTITNATLDTLLEIEADNLVRLDTANGGLFVLDANGGLAGDIAIFATDFIAATDQAFTDIAGLSVAEIDERLANSDGVDRPEGVIRANTLDIATTASQVFIQNTAVGTDFDQRRGFDVNSLDISSGGGTGSVQPIVINGIVGGVTGIDTIAQTGVLSPTDAASTINGCLIADPASCSTTVTPTPTPPPSPTPSPTPPPSPPSGDTDTSQNGEIETRDLIDDGLTPPDIRPEGFLQGGLITINPDTAFEDDPLIDDPVTGAGNEDLWVDDDAECEEGEECGV